mmetsp:Transcript_103696/g.199051  ORF Transcript_103696/g.199051 Transcript_103696/m.199051 type:complete len:212 (-) Transcript_103696:661-1296(-)
MPSSTFRAISADHCHGQRTPQWKHAMSRPPVVGPTSCAAAVRSDTTSKKFSSWQSTLAGTTQSIHGRHLTPATAVKPALLTVYVNFVLTLTGFSARTELQDPQAIVIMLLPATECESRLPSMPLAAISASLTDLYMPSSVDFELARRRGSCCFSAVFNSSGCSSSSSSPSSGAFRFCQGPDSHSPHQSQFEASMRGPPICSIGWMVATIGA